MYDICTHQSLRNLPGIRAANKFLWHMWIAGAGRCKHTEYVLTETNAYYPTGAPVPWRGIDTSSSILWGNVKLYNNTPSSNIIYTAGFAHEKVVYIVKIVGAHRLGQIQRLKCATFIKSDCGLSTIISCICARDTPIETVFRASKCFLLKIITASRVYNFGVRLPQYGDYTKPHVTAVSDLRRQSAQITNIAPILKLLEFAKTTDLDIARHLPPLEIYDKLLAEQRTAV